MPNQYKNKVVYNGTALIDLTSDTITASALMQGYTAHDASGAPITGTATGGSMVIRDEADSHGGTVRHITAGTVVTGTTSITENGSYDVAQYADAVVNVSGGSNAFVVTLSHNNQTEMWEPDCTFDEAEAAYIAEKNVVFECVPDYPDLTANGSYENSFGMGKIYYLVNVPYQSGDYLTYGVEQCGYIWDADDISVDLDEEYYSTAAATALPSDVLSGKKFYNVSGYSVGTIPSKTEYDLAVSGATVTVPAGHYASQATKSVASGTAGTPTATKGTVSNHAISVTPSVTNSTGYITGGTKSGTAVTVSASELVSGTLEVTESGTYDVTNYASADVSVSGGATNFVQGTFTTSSTTGSAQTIDIPYTGAGYPIIAHVEVTGGFNNESNTEWYDAIRRFSVGLWHMSKNNPNTGFKNYDTGAMTTYKKNSTTDANQYSSESTVSYYYAQSYGAGSNATYDVVTFTSKTQLSVFVSDSGTRGLMPSISYSYYIVYSE